MENISVLIVIYHIILISFNQIWKDLNNQIEDQKKGSEATFNDNDSYIWQAKITWENCATCSPDNIEDCKKCWKNLNKRKVN